MLSAWRVRVERARTRLGWTARADLGAAAILNSSRPEVVARTHPGGASLALAAPCDQLFVATEINEWALCAALYERNPARWHELEDALVSSALEDAPDPDAVLRPVLEEGLALARFERLAAQEARPKLRALLQEARKHQLQYVLDDEELTLGGGGGARQFPLTDLPDPAGVAWPALHDVPTALITGSNGKTTTVRLLAACARAHGWLPAYSCTDGVFVGTECVATGDYSGPAGARRVLREPRTEAAILETARGGILRRGIAVSEAHVAVVTNISSDHFGEYGIYDLDGLADVKLSVAGVLAPDGHLILNADDALLRAKSTTLAQRFGRQIEIGWFSLDADCETLRQHRARGGWSCGVRDGRLILTRGKPGAASGDQDLGPIAQMPLTVEGSATYNIGNVAAAALAAAALGISPANISRVLAEFGTHRDDNLGRMMRFEARGAQVVLDYAHNPEGLRGLLRVAQHLRRGGGRLGLILGHAGNRRDVDLEELAGTAVEFHPDLIVVKENEGHLRGRELGEVPRILHAALIRAGMPEAAVPVRTSELEATRYALDWAQPGDVLALPVHSASARAEVILLLESLRSSVTDL